MAPNRIFLVELIVEELQMFPTDDEVPPEDPPKKSPETKEEENGTREEPDTLKSCPERCVRFELGRLVRCEVCEKDFGSHLDMTHAKQGESCMFTLNESDLEDDSLKYTIKAMEKLKDGGGKKMIGRWDEPANEIFATLASNYDNVNGTEGASESKGTIRSEDSMSKGSIPVSDTVKSMYPLQGEGEKICGYAICTLRFSCLGSRITQKVLFGGKEDQPALTCFKAVTEENDERYMKCVAYDEVAHPHPVICGECEESKLPSTPVPPVPSVEMACSPFDEYTAELNGNAISIRVEKSSEIKVMLDGEESKGCTKGCWTSLTLPEGVYALEERYVKRQENACRLPVVRGNLKYPAEQWSTDFMMCKRKRPFCAEDYRKRPEPMRSICMQTRDPELQDPPSKSGIEICKKGWHDPNVDVFVLKLGKNKTLRGDGAANQIELELRTPKGPMVEKRPKETRGVQVIEEEFEDFRKASVPEEAKKPKKAAKKSKKK
ncbi:uncharacterized protein LOC129766413 [Toxorhynchites rutilus septentrionalis]|uniref:uncharacterized protein LOC129766413 n=1 Tax=Toxorhynchites rutilus septentrionalis TaxID=329112 RepID=UPI0024791C6C|nr:uncharacterized protein LOC129766413 [Toxorhynchites rutilus septentrionalis]